MEKMTNKQKEILAKADAINKENADYERYKRDCCRAMLCPKCGEKIEFKSLPQSRTYDDVFVYGEWNCSKCNFKLSFDEKELMFIGH